MLVYSASTRVKYYYFGQKLHMGKYIKLFFNANAFSPQIFQGRLTYESTSTRVTSTESWHTNVSECVATVLALATFLLIQFLPYIHV